MLLEDIAEILRCQVYRRPAAEKEEGILEMRPEDFESVSGIVSFAPGEPQGMVMAGISSRSSKFLLRQNDVLVRMIGGIESIGATCFVASQPAKPTVPSKSLLIIRPNLKVIDPVWLFYRLSQQDIRKKLQESAADAKPRYITRETVKRLEVSLPTETAIRSARMAHEKFLENLGLLEGKKKEEREEWQRLAESLK